MVTFFISLRTKKGSTLLHFLGGKLLEMEVGMSRNLKELWELFVDFFENKKKSIVFRKILAIELVTIGNFLVISFRTKKRFHTIALSWRENIG